jgi:hypothetical protein
LPGTNTLAYLASSSASKKKSLITLTPGASYKNTMVNYRRNFNPTFSTVKMMQYITAILGSISLCSIGYTNTAVIYCHSTVITKEMLLYKTE